MATQNINVNATGNSSSLVSAANRASSALKSLNSTITASANTFNKLNTSINSVAKGMTKIATALPARAFGALGSAIRSVNGFFAQHNRTLAMSANYYKGLVGQVASLNRFINVLGSSIRQIGQGLQNFAMVFSIYVSAPVTAFVASMTKGFIEFQDKMIEVRRTTGLSLSDVEKLMRALQEYSLVTATSVQDLATMAAAWGRLGITGTSAIAQLTRESDKLMLATNLTANQVVDDLGKIGTIYFDTSDELAASYDNLGSAINELGQASPVSESDIIAAILRVAPVAKQLDISLPDLLGLGTTVAERAASPERAGTQLARALTENASNVDKFAKALNMTEDATRDLIDADPLNFFLSIVDAIGQIGSATQRVDLANALFGGVGEKAINALGASLPGLYDNIVLANKAFDEGTSLQREYERSTDSVKVQIGILNNNFKYLGYTVAEVVIPYITKFATIAIPAVRAAADAFNNLNERTKLMIVGFGALLAIVGPVAIFLGSLLFTIGIMTTGFTALFTQVLAVGGGIGRLALALVSLLSPLGTVRLAILGIAGAFLYVHNIVNQTGNFLSSALGKFAQWGYNLFGSFAQGILNASSVVYKAVGTIIDSFIGLIQAFSPPKEGPLTGVERWGTGLMEAYAVGIVKGSDKVTKGFLKSLNDTAGVYKHQFRSLLPFINKIGAETTTAVIDGSSKGLQTGLKIVAETKSKSVQAGEGIAKGVADGIQNKIGAIGQQMGNMRTVIEDGVTYIITLGAKFSDAFAKSLSGLDANGVDMFSKLFSDIRGAIEAVGNNLGLDKSVIDKRIQTAAEILAKVLNGFENGDGIGNFKELYDILGGLGDEVDNLVNSQLEYNKASRELSKIKKDQEDIDDALRRQIESISARTDLTMDQKSALIRNARFRSGVRKQELEDEQKKAQERVDTLEDEAKRREQILNILTGLMAPAEKQRQKDPKEDDLAGDLKDIDFGSVQDGIDDAFKRLKEGSDEMTQTFFSKIQKASDVWRGFIAGITGDTSNFDREGADFWSGFIPGQTIRLAIGDITEQFQIFKDMADAAYLSVSTLWTIFTGGIGTGYLGLSSQAISSWSTFETIVYNIGMFLGAATREAEKIATIFGGSFGAIGDEISKTWSQTGNIGDFIKNFDFKMVGVELANAFNEALGMYFGGFDSSVISALISGLINSVIGFVKTFDFGPMAEFALSIINGIIHGFTDFSANAGKIDLFGLSEFVTNFVNGIITFLSKVDFKSFTLAIQELAWAILNGLANVDFTKFQDLLSSILIGIFDLIGNQQLLNLLATVLGNIINSIFNVLANSDVATALGEAMAHLVNAVSLLLQKIDWEMISSDIFTNLADAIAIALINIDWTELVKGVWTAANEAVTGFFKTAIFGAESGSDTNMQNDPYSMQNYMQNHESSGLPPGVEPPWWLTWMFPGSGNQTPPPSAVPQSQMTPATGPGSTWVGDTAPVDYRRPEDQMNGSMAAETYLPLVLAPAVLAEAQQSGSTWNNSFLTGIDTAVKSPESTTQVSSGIKSLLTSVVAETEVDNTKSGVEMGTHVVTGMTDHYGSSTTQTDLSTMITAMGTWVTTNEDNLNYVGESIAKEVMVGMINQLEDTDVYMNPMITKLSTWIKTATNKEKLDNAGQELGQEILGGVGTILNEAANYITSILTNVLAGTPLTEAQRLALMPKTDRELAGTAMLGPMVSTSNASTSAITLEVNFNGAIPKDRREIDYILEEMMKKLRKETNIRG